ncbi:hypothetical protein D3C71_755680 [compost metagenome]
MTLAPTASGSGAVAIPLVTTTPLTVMDAPACAATGVSDSWATPWGTVAVYAVTPPANAGLSAPCDNASDASAALGDGEAFTSTVMPPRPLAMAMSNRPSLLKSATTICSGVPPTNRRSGAPSPPGAP